MTEERASVTDTIQIRHYMRMRQVTIQYLRMLEDELIAIGGLKPSDRACITRDERRAASRFVDMEGQSL